MSVICVARNWINLPRTRCIYSHWENRSPNLTRTCGMRNQNQKSKPQFHYQIVAFLIYTRHVNCTIGKLPGPICDEKTFVSRKKRASDVLLMFRQMLPPLIQCKNHAVVPWITPLLSVGWGTCATQLGKARCSAQVLVFRLELHPHYGWNRKTWG